jgi:hypothetical protein
MLYTHQYAMILCGADIPPPRFDAIESGFGGNKFPYDLLRIMDLD